MHDECALAMRSLADICTGIEAPGLRLSLLLTHGLPGWPWRAQAASWSLQAFSWPAHRHAVRGTVQPEQEVIPP